MFVIFSFYLINQIKSTLKVKKREKCTQHTRDRLSVKNKKPVIECLFEILSTFRIMNGFKHEFIDYQTPLFYSSTPSWINTDNYPGKE